MSCHGWKLTDSPGQTKLTNFPGEQELEILSHTWSGCTCDKFVCLLASWHQANDFFKFGGITKPFNASFGASQLSAYYSLRYKFRLVFTVWQKLVRIISLTLNFRNLSCGYRYNVNKRFLVSRLQKLISNVFFGSRFLCAELKNDPSYCLLNICFCNNNVSWSREYTLVCIFVLHAPQ